MRRGLIVCVLACACAPAGSGPLVAGESRVVAELGDDDAPLALHAYDGPFGELPETLVASRAHRYRWLAYDASLEALRVTGGLDGAIALEGASDPEGWSLPSPARALELDASGAARTLDERETRTWLESFSVSSEACERLDVAAIRGIPHPYAVSAVLEVGGELLLAAGTRVDSDESPGPAKLLRLDVATRVASEVPGFDDGAAERRGPKGFVDGDEAWIVWPVPGGEYELRRVPRDGEHELERWSTPLAPELAGAAIHDLAFRRVGGARLVIGRVQTATHTYALVTLDEATRTWRPLEPIPASTRCGGMRLEGNHALQIEDDGAILAGFDGVGLERVRLAGGRLSAREPVLAEETACATAYTRLPGGLEVAIVFFEAPQGGAGKRLSWRSPGEPTWHAREDLGYLRPQALAPLPNGFAHAAPDFQLARWDFDAFRPSKPLPCGTERLATNPYYLVPLSPDRWLVAGSGTLRGEGQAAVLLERRAP